MRSFLLPACLGAGVVVLFAWTTTTPVVSSPPVVVAASETPSGELERLRRRLDALEAGRSEAAPGSTPVAAVEAPPERPPVPTPEELEAQEDDAWAQTVHLDEVLAATPGEDGWAEGARETLVSRAAEVDLHGAQVLDVSCGGRFCRVRVAAPEAGLAEQLHADLPGLAPWPSSGMIHTDAATGTVALYVAKEGEQLPLEI